MVSEDAAARVAEVRHVLERCVGTYQSCALSPQGAAALLQHIDTQAARLEKLAALEQAARAWSEINVQPAGAVFSPDEWDARREASQALHRAVRHLAAPPGEEA